MRAIAMRAVLKPRRLGAPRRALWMAAWSGDHDRFAAKFAAAATADEKRAAIAASNDHGWNALHFAAVYDRRGMLEPMLEACPELVSAPNKQGWRPLHYAAGFGQPAVINMLLAHGAELDCRNEIAAEYKGYTPLHRAFRWWLDPNKPNAIAHLLSIGADPTALDEAGRSPVELTSDNCCAPALRALAEAHGAGRAAACLSLQSAATQSRLRDNAAAAEAASRAAEPGSA